MWVCKHCKKSFSLKTTSEKANHSRWCDKNPKRNDTENLKIAQRKKIDEQYGLITNFTVQCNVCKKSFVVQEREKTFPKKDKYFCSNSCAHHRGDGLNWANLRNIALTRYTSICFAHHNKKCVVCGEENIVSVHHLDENHDNNNPENLIPVCPTHHQYWHSSFRHLVEPTILNYINDWIIRQSQQHRPNSNDA